ncbi:hypothetical protein GCM10028796_28090 [Ramlibacter monticola]|uniref:Transporter n=1 Tax=Ramlibacter monticola TaxID=1926872 RepID=A0A936Z496_9BURK|nr:hypothetical protein [Ramlibacter monticola]MBL0393861.1 hypothetical protein [Ramlibacter monticola]
MTPGPRAAHPSKKGSVVFAALAAALSVPQAAAQPSISGSDPRALVEELRSEEDPTLLVPRFWVDTEWNSFRDSSSDFDLTLGRLWAWRLSPTQDWALRLKLPLRTHSAGAAPGDSDKQGIGDLKLAVGTAVRLDASRRLGAGLEMRFPTATEPALGANVWRPMVFGVFAWDITPAVTFSPSVEYNKSIAEKNGAAPQHYAEFFFPLTFVVGRWAFTPRYEFKVDFANGDEVTRSAKFLASTRLEDRPLGFAFSVKMPLDKVDKKLQLNFVTTWYLR